jgi:hypothetical protein
VYMFMILCVYCTVSGIANTDLLGSPCRGWAGRPRRGAGGRPRGRLLSTCTGTVGRTGNSECSSPGLSGIASPLRLKSTSVGSYLDLSYKGIGSPPDIFLRPIKLNRTFSVHAEIVFKFFACLAYKRNKYKASACLYENTNYKDSYKSTKFLYWLSFTLIGQFSLVYVHSCLAYGTIFSWRLSEQLLESQVLCSSCGALFYRKRLPQQNGDMRKRDLHAFKLCVEQGRLPLPSHTQ